MNKQYQELQVQEGVYIPQPALKYPEENPFERTLFPKQIKNIDFDEHYPYIDDSIKYQLNLLWGYYLVVHIILRLKLRIQMGSNVRIIEMSSISDVLESHWEIWLLDCSMANGHIIPTNSALNIVIAIV